MCVVRMFDLSGKKALVTGSSQGIGYAIAKSLGEFGATVFVNGTDSQKAKAAADSIGGIPAVCDLSTPDCAEKLYEITKDIDILVLNASVQIRKAWDEITDDEYETQININ